MHINAEDFRNMAVKSVFKLFLIHLLSPPLVSSFAPSAPRCASASLPVVAACVPRSVAVLAVVSSGLQSAPYWPTADAGSPASESIPQGCL